MKRRIIPYNRDLKEKARLLRNNSTFGEILLWKKLRGKQFFGYDFHRQKPLLNYIVDFYCAELNLVIEIDGKYHNNGEPYERDLRRQRELEKYQLNFLRFSEIQMRTQMINVLRAIELYISDFEKKHTPGPSQEGNVYDDDNA
jgi:very-short-patch-repair endonuclease